MADIFYKTDAIKKGLLMSYTFRTLDWDMLAGKTTEVIVAFHINLLFMAGSDLWTID